MSYNYGLELELFFKDPNGNIAPPPARSNLPVDGFAGLVEIRSIVSADIYEVYGDVVQKRQKLQDEHNCELILEPSHKFSAQELGRIKTNRYAPNKSREHIVTNIYGARPRLLGAGRAQASLQINISLEVRAAYKTNEAPPRHVPAVFGLFDFLPVIRGLDFKFADAITGSRRAAGWYAIKDQTRLEYRSLPNTAFTPDLPRIVAALMKGTGNENYDDDEGRANSTT